MAILGAVTALIAAATSRRSRDTSGGRSSSGSADAPRRGRGHAPGQERDQPADELAAERQAIDGDAEAFGNIAEWTNETPGSNGRDAAE